MAYLQSNSVQKRLGERMTPMGALKKIIKSALHSLGYDLHKIYESKKRVFLGDALMFVANHPCGFRPRTVIDVGVATGTPELYAQYSESKFLLVEPLIEFESDIKGICSRYDAVYAIGAAAGAEGETTIHVMPDLVGSSILTPKEKCSFGKRTVQTFRLDTLIEKFKLAGPFLLKVDAQSGELEVLKGSPMIIQQSEVIILETPFFQFVEQGPQFYDVIEFLKKAGFVVFDIVGHNYRPLDNALAEVDLVFVKEFGMFRSSHHFSNLAQREQQF